MERGFEYEVMMYLLQRGLIGLLGFRDRTVEVKPKTACDDTWQEEERREYEAIQAFHVAPREWTGRVASISVRDLWGSLSSPSFII